MEPLLLTPDQAAEVLQISKSLFPPPGCFTSSRSLLIHLRIAQWDTLASSAARRTVM